MEEIRLRKLKDSIQNAILVGMSYSDALILAGASLEEISYLDNDVDFQRERKACEKALEKQLLNTLMDTITIQAEKGKDHGVTWLLSKLNPRYRGEEEKGANAGSVIINTQQVDVTNPDNAVEFDEV